MIWKHDTEVEDKVGCQIHSSILYYTGIYLASNRNEYQKIFLGE
jgi:hypothetical protein